MDITGVRRSDRRDRYSNRSEVSGAAFGAIGATWDGLAQSSMVQCYYDCSLCIGLIGTSYKRC